MTAPPDFQAQWQQLWEESETLDDLREKTVAALVAAYQQGQENDRQAFEAGERVGYDACSIDERGVTGDPKPVITDYDSWVQQGRPEPYGKAWPEDVPLVPPGTAQER